MFFVQVAVKHRGLRAEIFGSVDSFLHRTLLDVPGCLKAARIKWTRSLENREGQRFVLKPPKALSGIFLSGLKIHQRPIDFLYVWG